MALMIGCIWHGLDALQARAKPGNHLVTITVQLLGPQTPRRNRWCNCKGNYFLVTFLSICPSENPAYGPVSFTLIRGSCRTAVAHVPASCSTAGLITAL